MGFGKTLERFEEIFSLRLQGKASSVCPNQSAAVKHLFAGYMRSWQVKLAGEVALEKLAGEVAGEICSRN